MKRILVLALALFLAVSSLAVPSYAAEIESSVEDLLTGFEYELYKDGVSQGSLSLPSQWVGGVSSVEWVWRYPSNVRYSGFTVFVQTDVAPSSVIYDTQWGQEVTGTLIHRSGNVSQYYFPFFNPTTFIGIDIRFASPYYGDVNIVSAFAYLDDTASVSSASWFANAMTRTLDYDEYGQPLDGFLSPISVGSGTETLPITVSWDGPSTGDNVLDYGEFFATFPFSDTYTSLESATYLFFTCGQILDYGARLVDSSGSIVASLSCDLINSGQTQMVYELSENFERIWCYSLVVDLEGYDLSDLQLQVSLNIDKVFSSSVANHEYGFFCQLNSIICKYPSVERDLFTDFVFWLSSKFNVLFSNLTSGFSSVVSSVSEWGVNLRDSIYNSGVSIVNSVSSWGANLRDTIYNSGVSIVSSVSEWGLNLRDTIYNSGVSIVHSVSSWGETLNNSIWNVGKMLADILNASGDNQGFQDEVDDQGDRLDQMDDALSSVTKPALDRVDTNISGIVSDTDLANTAHVYTYIIDDNIMAPALTMVTILAMMSFALFGKR